MSILSPEERALCEKILADRTKEYAMTEDPELLDELALWKLLLDETEGVQ
jgi:hypothetical protein